MKVTVLKQDTTPKTYPCIKVSEQGRVVIFTSPQSGVLLLDPTGINSFGHRSDSWAEASFRQFSGTLQIEC